MLTKLLVFGLGLGVILALIVAGKNAYDMARATKLEPPTGRILDVNGVKVHAHIEGSGPTLILIHGAGGNTREFTFSLVEKLTDRFQIVAFDRPGHGHSERLPDREFLGETVQEQAALLNAAAMQLGLSDYLVLGHSFGGAVTMAWALNHPGEIRGAVMLAAVSNPWEGDLAQWYQTTNSWIGRNLLLPTLSAFATQARIIDTLEGIFTPDPVPAGYMDHIGIRLSKTKRILQATTQQVNNLKPSVTAMAPRYASLALPIESIHGSADVTVPLATHALPLQQQMPSNNLTIIEGAGHMPHHVDEPAVLAAIERVAKRAGLTN